MKKLCPEVNVLKEWPIVQRELMDVNALLAGEQTEHSTKHEWIQCMKDFRRLLFDAERYYERGKPEEIIEEPIKIALIDDGVDVKDLEFGFIGGRTFCTRDEEHNLNDPYYVSSTGHGTIMAKQIHMLCPRAQFYVLRLEDHAAEEGSRQLTAKSAALVRQNKYLSFSRPLWKTNHNLGNHGGCKEESSHHFHVLDNRPPRRRRREAIS
jgi:hypothetical protein